MAILSELEREPLKARRISVDEAQTDPDVFDKRVIERVVELLKKYGWEVREGKVTDRGLTRTVNIVAERKRKHNGAA